VHIPCFYFIIKKVGLVKVMIDILIGYIKQKKFKIILMILPIMMAVSVLFANSVSKNSQAKYVTDVIYKNFPSFQAQIIDLNKSKLGELKNLNNVKNYELVDYYGKASYKNLTTNSIESFNKNYFNLYKLNLIDGKYPGNKNEIIVSSDFIKNTKLKLNSNVMLNIQKEYVTDDGTRTVYNSNQDFKIVGIYNYPDVVKKYGGFNNIFVSKLSNIPNEAITFNGYINLKTGFKDVENEVGMLSYELDSTSNHIVLNEAFEKALEENMGLGSEVDIFDKAIVVASALLIFNIFVLMTREITKELGLLRIVGMSKKQTALFLILKNIFILVSGIVLGFILGHILAYISTRNFTLTTSLINPHNAPIIYRYIDYVRPVVVITVTVSISILIPIFRIVKASPIQLYSNYIVSNNKLSKLLNKIFVRKNKYIVNQIALNNIFTNFIPVILSSIVIGISGYLYLSNYISDNDEIYISPELQNLEGYDIELKHNESILPIIDGYKMYDVDRIKQIKGFKDLKITNTDNCYIDIDQSRVSKKYKQQNLISDDSKINNFKMNLVAVDINSLDKMIKENNLLESGSTIKESDDKIPEVILFNKYYDYRDAGVSDFIDGIKEGDIVDIDIKGLDKNNNVIYKKQKVKVAGLFSKSWLNLNDSERLVPDVVMSLKDYEKVTNINNFNSIKVSFNSKDKENSINKVTKMMEDKKYFDYDTVNKILKAINERAWQVKVKKLTTSYILIFLTMANVFFIIMANVIIRKKDYSIMRAIGMPKIYLRKIIIREGLFYALVGSTIATGMTIISNIEWVNYLKERSIAKGFKYTGEWYDLPYKYIFIFVILSTLVCTIAAILAYIKTRNMNFTDSENEK
jgi:putative ABC transport system permease protein